MKRLLDLTADEVRALSREKTVFLISVGSFEDRGPHLTLGSSYSFSEAFLKRLSTRIENENPGFEAVLMPSLPLGIDSATSEVAFPVRAHVVRDWLVDSTQTLIRLGFRLFVCFSSDRGPRQIAAIEEVGPILRRRFPGLRKKKAPQFLSLSSNWVSAGEKRRSLFFQNPLENGGKEATSLALAIDPKSVRESAVNLPSLPPPRGFKGYWDGLMHRKKGYWGEAPSLARSEDGEGILTRLTEEGASEVKRLIEGASDRSNRSGYLYLPHARSFFRAWLWAIASFVLLFFWLSMTLFYLPR